ncbi:MAG: sugar transferase [Candidatus Chisholmbacteria bacterium]|nr:sugar transferase [Candidatus Chisholmbacteria bacterium]
MNYSGHNLTSEHHLGRFLTGLNAKLQLEEIFHGFIDLKKHPVSKTELIGTMVHTGFDILKEKAKNGQLHFTLKKVAAHGPLQEIANAKRWIFRQNRVGFGGSPINIYKLRTMYPMAHKAYDYVMKHQTPGLYGKLTNDFRITKIGKILRRYWIDELLQFINILKGEMKLVGLRPLSEDFFKTLPPSLQQERLKHLPALMAAVYADRPKNLEERFASELRYLESHAQHPFLTDLKYFFKILWAIIFRGQRGH